MANITKPDRWIAALAGSLAAIISIWLS